jgi:succinate-semialdehyde dehydrogenase/glutarate-semialdehyde dehydrogenase
MKMIINGQKVDASDKKVMEVINPATGELIDTAPCATREDVNKAIDSAQEGRRLWGATPQHERTRILMKCADILDAHAEELANLICKEMGKTLKDCRGEAGACGRIIRGFVERANHLYGETFPTSWPGVENDVIFTRREPLGVVICVIPFNFPASTMAYKIGAALPMGNAVIVKPSSENPLCDIRMVELLLEAGLPPSVIQVVTGSGSVIGGYFTDSPKVNCIFLTGSSEVGVTVARNASTNLQRVYLELGGNDVLIILDDADLDLAVEEVLIGRIATCGQMCVSTKRLLVQSGVKDKFTKLLVDRISKLKVGDPFDPATDVGCLISEKAAIDVENQVNHTIKQGAKCAIGGKRFQKTFFEPTVLTDVTKDMDVAKNLEIFGPVMPIIGFDTVDEAVEIANSSVYGLSGGVMTRDISKGLKVAMSIETGTMVVNGTGRYRHYDHAFGGYKMSGLGREGIGYTLEEMSQVKTVALKRILK